MCLHAQKDAFLQLQNALFPFEFIADAETRPQPDRPPLERVFKSPQRQSLDSLGHRQERNVFSIHLFPVKYLMPAQKIQAVAGIINIHFHSLAEKLIHQLDIADGVIHTAAQRPQDINCLTALARRRQKRQLRIRLILLRFMDLKFDVRLVLIFFQNLFVHRVQIADHRIDKPGDVLSEGQMVDVKIIDIDYDNKKVSLSIRALLEGGDEPAESEDVNEE